MNPKKLERTKTSSVERPSWSFIQNQLKNASSVWSVDPLLTPPATAEELAEEERKKLLVELQKKLQALSQTEE